MRIGLAPIYCKARLRCGNVVRTPATALAVAMIASWVASAWADKPPGSPAVTAPLSAAAGNAAAVEFTTRPLVAGRPEAAAIAGTPAGQPRLVLDADQLTAEPVWRGEVADFTYRVRNDGQADLRLRGKGG